jgi:hypothetical protein
LSSRSQRSESGSPLLERTANARYPLLELRARIGEADGLSLAALARERGAPKYEALGLGLAGERAKAAEVARRVGSDLVLCKVALGEEATSAMVRVASRLPQQLAVPFVGSQGDTRTL